MRLSREQTTGEGVRAKIVLGSTVIDPLRIDHAERLYLAGRAPRSIQRALVKAYGVEPRTARRYLALAKTRITKRGSSTPNPDAGRARAEEMLLEAAKLARAKGDPKALALCAQRLAELDGALGPKRIEVSGPNKGPIPIYDARARILAIIARGDEPDGAGGEAREPQQ